MKKRNFTQLQKSMTYWEFNNFCKKVTEQYANSEAKFARTYYTQMYNISESCYYRIIEYAIVTNLVNEKNVNKAMNKAIANQKLHNPNAGSTSLVKYSKMYAQRCEYISKSYTDEEVKEMVKIFTDNPNISKEDLASAYGISRKTFELVLIRAIEENIVENKTVDLMEKRSIENASLESKKGIEEYFNTLKKKREANKENNN